MICITGAGGTVGSEIVRQLGAANVPFRAAFFSKDKAEEARRRGQHVALIDYGRPDTLRAAFQDCDRLYLIGPNVPDQTRLELNAVQAAQAAGVRHVVKQSAMRADEEAYVVGRIHRDVERAIEASGLSFTHLRPNSFMQNVLTFMAPTIRAEGVFYSAAGPARISHVDVRDISAVAVRALTEAGHEGRAYTLTGPEAISYDELAGELSVAVGHAIRHVNLEPGDYRRGLMAEGLPEGLADVMLDLERFFREDGASSISRDVQRVTGRAPRRFQDFARECAPLLRAA